MQILLVDKLKTKLCQSTQARPASERVRHVATNLNALPGTNFKHLIQFECKET